MIKSFKNKGLERFATKGDGSKLSVQRPDRLQAMLRAVNLATTPTAMAFPGWRFHELAGDRKGTYSVTVNGNWRLTFKFDGQDAVDLDLEDYH